MNYQDEYALAANCPVCLVPPGEDCLRADSDYRLPHLTRITHAIQQTDQRLKEAETLLRGFADHDECRYDHHGACQTHGSGSDVPGDCLMARTRQHLAKTDEATELPPAAPAPTTPRPITELRDSGLLWLTNRVVFHPRGFALALHADADGHITGWSLQGDGGEAWSFPPGLDAAHFQAAERTLNAARGDR